jgi:L-ascorbate metabolism protein UlaG (beta-lactamase superfamily)
MSDEKLYFRHNVVIEPLFNQWYAWWYLISPMTASLYVANQHVKIMRSFVAQPQIHAAAMKNPALLGGPYINYEVNRVGEIDALLQRTIKERAHLLELAEAIKALDAMLESHPAGMSLEDFYPKIPDILRGYVELTYDLKNRPSMRLLEGMLYRSPYYDESAQSIALWRIESDERTFIFSTPRLAEPEHLHLRLPFRDPAIDELMRLRYTPASFEHIQELLHVPAEQADLLRSLLTEEPSARAAAPRYEGEGVRIRYCGHACVLIESKGVSVLTDPVVSYPYATGAPRYTHDDLPEKIDYVLITHTHPDHLMFETLLQLRSRIGTIVVPKNGGFMQDPSIRLGLQHLGFKNVIEIEEMDELKVEGGSIVGLPFLGEHGDLDIRSKLAYLLRLDGKSVVIAADSNALEPRIYGRVREMFGAVDALFLGMECDGAPMNWSYEPLLLVKLARKMDQSRRLSGCNFPRASEIVRLLEPKHVYIYAMGQEPWLNHVMALKYNETSVQITESDKLLEFCKGRGIVAERPYCQMELTLT